MNRLVLVLALLWSGSGLAEVLTLTQASMSAGQWARLVVALKNRGPGLLQLPKVAFDLNVPAGKTPEIQGWDAGTIGLRLEKQNETKYTVWLTSHTDLAEGATWNEGRGVSFGVHLSDWSNWDASSSPSWGQNSSQLAENSSLRVYDASGRLVGGPGSVPPVAANSTYQIGLDPGGICNVSGNQVIQVGSKLSVRCQPDVGMVGVGWDLDGVSQPVGLAMDVVADGRDHVIQVRFAPRSRLWVTVSSQGQGNALPSGDLAVYQGDSIVVGTTPAAGWNLDHWLVAGKESGSAPLLTLRNVQAATQVVAVFKPSPVVSGFSVLAREELPRDPRFSKARLRVRNTGTVRLEAGYQVEYIFRVPRYQIPSLSNWDVPAARSQLLDLGSGYWKVRFTSTVALVPGAEAGEGRGWYFGLQTGAEINWDVTGNIALPTGSDWANAPLIGVFDPSGVRVAGTEPTLNPSYPENIQVMALYREAEGDNTMLRPRIVLRNLGDQALSDFVYYWYFRTDSGQVPLVTPWFPNSNPPVLEALGNGNFRLRFDYTGLTLPPHTDLPTPDGNVTGIYLPGYPAWNKTLACSYLPGTIFQPDSAILVYDHAGKLLWGNPDAVKACGGLGGGEPIDSIEPISIRYPPVIVVQPRDTLVRAGGARFEVRATGEGTLQYQWRWNGAAILGADQPVLDLALVTPDQDGDAFSCAVSNAAGTTVSRKARLQVLQPPEVVEIVSQPQDDTVALGGDGVFSVALSGGAVRYQWFHDNRSMLGQNGSRLELRGVDHRDSGVYQVAVTLATGQKLMSRRARLSLVPRQPTSLVLSLSGSFQDTLSHLPDTTVDLSVRLFATPQGGSAVWSEEHRGVPIQKGAWYLEVGSTRQPPALDEIVSRHTGLYLEVALEGAFPMAFGPRVPLTSVPFAFSTGARIVYGHGAPLPALAGALYLDQIDQRLWQRKGLVWVRLDP